MEGSNPELQAKLAELEHELEVSLTPLDRNKGSAFRRVRFCALTGSKDCGLTWPYKC